MKDPVDVCGSEEAESEIVLGSYYWTLLLKDTPEVTDDRNSSTDVRQRLDRERYTDRET